MILLVSLFLTHPPPPPLFLSLSLSLYISLSPSLSLHSPSYLPSQPKEIPSHVVHLGALEGLCCRDEVAGAALADGKPDEQKGASFLGNKILCF